MTPPLMRLLPSDCVPPPPLAVMPLSNAGLEMLSGAVAADPQAARAAVRPINMKARNILFSCLTPTQRATSVQVAILLGAIRHPM